MNRASGALKRLGITGVAAATIAAGLSALAPAAAPAEATTSVSLTPATAAPTVNTCQTLTASVTPTAATALTAKIQQAVPATATIGFCDPTKALPANPPGSTDTTITTGADGKVAFGVFSTYAGTMTVAVGVPGSTTLRAMSTLTWTAPPPEKAPAATVVLTPATATATVGTCVDFVAAVTPPAGSKVATITVSLSGSGTRGFCIGNTRVSYTGARVFEETAAGKIAFGVFSQRAGTMYVTAVGQPNTVAAKDVSVIAWKTDKPQNIVVTPESVTKTAGETLTLTATVRDRFGNPVPGVAVLWSESGPGAFTTGTATVLASTDGHGRAYATVKSADEGTQTVTAAFRYPAATQCQTSPGNCSDSATVTWKLPPVALAITGVRQPSNVAGTQVTITGKGPRNGDVSMYMRNATTAGSFALLATVDVNGNGDWAYTFYPARTGTYYATAGSGSTLEKTSEITITVRVKVMIDRLAFYGKDTRGMCVTRFLGGVFPYIPGAPVWVRNSAVSPTQPIGYTKVFQKGGSGRYDAAFGLRCDQAYKLFALISGADSSGLRHADNGVSPDVPYIAGH